MEVDIPLEAIGVIIEKILHKLRDELALVGVGPVHMLGSLGLLDLRKGQVPLNIFTKSVLEFVPIPVFVPAHNNLEALLFQEDIGFASLLRPLSEHMCL
jgi:hypothetical protein